MRFFVETKFNHAPTDEVLALIPAEIARGKELDAQGIRVLLLVAADRSGAWQVYQADSLATVQQALESLPLHPFVTAIITPLAEASEFE